MELTEHAVPVDVSALSDQDGTSSVIAHTCDDGHTHASCRSMHST